VQAQPAAAQLPGTANRAAGADTTATKASYATSMTPGRVAPVAAPRPDYAIRMDSQQELENAAILWVFHIENKGQAAPEAKISSPTALSTGAKLAVSVGFPCPGDKNWKQIALEKVLPVPPGGTSKISYKMPEEYAGKGCRFRAEIIGPFDDVNTANNVIHMFSKKAAMPDLVIAPAPVLSGPGNGLDVMNIGNAPAGPSKFHFECTSHDATKTCGKPYEKHQWTVARDVPVPSLKPGQSFTVMGSTPNGVQWKAYADYGNEVVEANEANNQRAAAK
jgi:hypothetical protein